MHRYLAPLFAALTVALVAGVLLLAPSPAETAVTRYKIDKGHSAMNWKVKHMGVSYTYGRFNEFNGMFTIDDANLAKSTIEIDISADSIDSNDEGRDKHLRSPEFFNVEKYPSITFESTKITKASDTSYRVVGDFTLLGVTKEVVIRMTKIGEGKDFRGNYRMGFDGHVVIKRSAFGMTAMLKGIGDDVHITLGVEGIRMGDKPTK